MATPTQLSSTARVNDQPRAPHRRRRPVVAVVGILILAGLLYLGMGNGHQPIVATTASSSVSTTRPGMTPPVAPVASATHTATATRPAAATPAPPAGPDQGPTLLVEPAASTTPVLTRIAQAHRSIDLVMYELEDTSVETALATAASRGVTVRVLLNGGYYGKPDTPNKNLAAYTYLRTHGVMVAWTPAHFALTHQKTLIVDATTALIMTGNLTPQYYATSRDLMIADRNPKDVAAIEAAFAADWNDQVTSASNGTDLVWSPGARPALLALIDQAKVTLNIYNEEMHDPTITAALIAAAKRGVIVRVVMTYQTSWKSAFSALTAGGVQVRTYAASAPLYIHAKMILADGQRAFVGSENFSPTSLDKNRELGLVVTNLTALKTLTATFNGDWGSARPFGMSSATATTPTATSNSPAAYYTSSYHSATHYYPASCTAWHSLSAAYLVSYPSVSALLQAYPDRTLGPNCSS